MPLVPNPIERLFFLRLNKGPGFFLDLFAVGAFHAAAAAARLGVFEALARSPSTADGLAREVRADPRAIHILLAYLDSFGYVVERGGRWENSRMTARWLVGGAPDDLSEALPFWDGFGFAFWREHLEAAVRAGGPPETIYEWFQPHEGAWRSFQTYVMQLAHFSAAKVAAAVPIEAGPRRLLDVGGGHGRFTIELCRRHPRLTATIFDLEPALGIAREAVGAAGLQDRVALEPGDYLQDPLGSGYDVALLFSILHAHRPEDVRRLLERVADALAPGGFVAIMDQLAGEARGRALLALTRFFELTYLTGLGGRIYSYGEYRESLEGTGYIDVRRVRLRGARGIGLVIARKPSAGG